MDLEKQRILRQAGGGFSAADGILGQAFGSTDQKAPSERPRGPAKKSDPTTPLSPGNRIIRGKTAFISAAPVEIAEIEYVADYPVPEEPGVDPDLSEPLQAPAPAPNLELLRAEWDAQWQERLEDELARAREQAFEDGYRSAMAELEQTYTEKLSSLAQDVERFGSIWEDFLAECEPLMGEIAFGVAQAILDAPLPQGTKGVASRAIIEAVELLRGHAPVEIAIHPVDFLRLQESGIVDQLESLNSEIRWEPTSDIKQGEWVVQSPVAVIRRLEEELFSTLKSRVGLLTAVQSKKPAAADPGA